MIFCVEDDNNIRELVVYTLETTRSKLAALKMEADFLRLWRWIRQSLFFLILCCRERMGFLF